MQHEIIILVEHLDNCRYFYRERLGLGEPVTESNSLMRFRIGEEAYLVLEQHVAPFLERSSGACRLMLELPNYSEVVAALRQNGFHCSVEFQRNGVSCCRVLDPEGNVIFLSSPR